MTETLPQLVRKRAEKLLEEYCRQRTASLERPEVKLTCERQDGGYLLLESFVEAGETKLQPIVSFRYQPELCQWSLHAPHDGRWRFCSNVPPHLDLAKLLDFVDIDPFKQFWR